MLLLLRRGAADQRRRLAFLSSSSSLTTSSSASQFFSSFFSSCSSSAAADSSSGLLSEPQAVIIALGGNVGDVPSAMASALEALPFRLGGRKALRDDEPASFVVAASRLYASEAAYVVDQPPFHNAAAALVTRLPPLALLRALKGIERDAGRGETRGGGVEEKPAVRFGPRPLDLDIVFYGGLRGTFFDDEQKSSRGVVDNGNVDETETEADDDVVSAAVAQGLELPHPRWSERAFVMAPVCDLVGGVEGGEETLFDEEKDRREKRESALELFGFSDDDERRKRCYHRRRHPRFSLRPPGASFPLPSRESAEGVASSLAEAARAWRRLVRGSFSDSSSRSLSPEADCRLGGGGGGGGGAGGSGSASSSSSSSSSSSGCWPVLPLPHSGGSSGGGWRAQARTPRMMAVLNVTPDSFSDGGKLMMKRAKEKEEQGAADADADANIDADKGDKIETEEPEADIAAVLSAAREAVLSGADLVDVGGQSTRPGALKVSPEVEARRVVPVVRALANDEFFISRKIPVSVDTFYASVAGECLRGGAHIVNDVTGGKGDGGGEDGAMARAVAGAGGVLVLTHNRGGGSSKIKKKKKDSESSSSSSSSSSSFDPSGGSVDSDYGDYGGDVAVGVALELAAAVEDAATARKAMTTTTTASTSTPTTREDEISSSPRFSSSSPPSNHHLLPPPTLLMPWSIILDPGLGFSKTQAQNLSLLARTDDVRRAMPPQYRTMPVLVGASRKGFLGAAAAVDEGSSSSSSSSALPHPRDAATVGSSAVAAAAGADLLRVHEVRANKEAAAVGAAVRWGGDVAK